MSGIQEDDDNGTATVAAKTEGNVLVNHNSKLGWYLIEEKMFEGDFLDLHLLLLLIVIDV